MLGDTTEKSKNPLKKAMRRRNAKQVTFSAPTYVEPSEYEYSTDEEVEDDASLTNGGPGGQLEQSNDQNSNSSTEKDEISTVAPLSIKQVRDSSPEKKTASEETSDQDRRKTIDESRDRDEIFERECD